MGDFADLKNSSAKRLAKQKLEKEQGLVNPVLHLTVRSSLLLFCRRPYRRWLWDGQRRPSTDSFDSYGDQVFVRVHKISPVVFGNPECSTSMRPLSLMLNLA